MTRDLCRALCLSALLLGCAHHKTNRPAQSSPASQARAEVQAERSAHVAPARERTAVDLPEQRDPSDRERIAASGAELPSRTEELNALDQGNSELDLGTTQRIRQAVVDDDFLSFQAKNVKIITRDGHVTLRGGVKSAEEKQAIWQHAQAVAGAAHVTNQLEVAP